MSLLNSKNSLRIKRVTPRIISRSYREKLRRTEGGCDVHSCQGSKNAYLSEPSVPNDVEKELQSEICMKGGIVVSAAAHHNPMLTLKEEEDLRFQNVDFVQSRNVPNFRVTCGDNNKTIDETNIRLPGVADEVESYPCPICGPEKVFLTVSGLERHTQETHPQYLDNVKASIEHIQNEWNRRRNQRVINIKQQFKRFDESSMFGKNSTIIVMRRNPNTADNFSESQMQQYEVCKLCGTMVSTAFLGVMEKHIQAHKKNNELRQHLLQEFGQKFVDSVTCKECSLVFTDERKYSDHILLNHGKRRNFVCRWCGKLFQSVADLNIHKQNVHNIATNTSKYIAYNGGNESESSVDDQQQKNDRLLESFSDANCDQNVPCKTKCQMCGLSIVKPSLLLRHMLRVHNQHNFDAEIVSRFRAPLKFSISSTGHVTWICCDECFSDRERILLHRRLMHGSYCIVPLPNTSADDNLQRIDFPEENLPVVCPKVILDNEESPIEIVSLKKETEKICRSPTKEKLIVDDINTDKLDSAKYSTDKANKISVAELIIPATLVNEQLPFDEALEKFV